MIEWFRSLQTDDLSRLIARLTGVAIVVYLLRLTVQEYWSEPSAFPTIGLSLSTLAVTATFYWVFAEERSGRLPFASLRLIALMMAWLTALQVAVASYQFYLQISYWRAVNPAPEILEFGIAVLLLGFALVSVGFYLRIAGVLQRPSMKILALVLLMPEVLYVIGTPARMVLIAQAMYHSSLYSVLREGLGLNPLVVIDGVLNFVLAVVRALFFWTLIRSPQPVAAEAEPEAVEA